MGNFNNENLIPFIGELKPGQRLLKRPDGYFIPVGMSGGSNAVAGYFADLDGNGLKFYPVGSNNGESVNQIMIADTGENEPEYEGGNSMDFYKCASVDTTNHTWTGYKAIYNSTTGIYNFEVTTTNLNWTTVKPQVGKIYSTDLKVVVSSLDTGIPNDPIFYAPLNEYSSTASTGQNISSFTNVTYTTEDGIDCAYFNTGEIDIAEGIELNTGDSFAISLWIKTSILNRDMTIFLIPGTSGDPNTGITVGTSNNYAGVSNTGTISLNSTSNASDWRNVIINGNASTISIYINGIFNVSRQMWNIDQASPLGAHIGDSSTTYNTHFIGYIASVRVFHRELTPSEIVSLSSEFTPIIS